MLLDLSEIVMREGMRVELDVDQPGVEDPDLIFAAPLRGHLAFANSGDLVNIHGNAETALLIPCNRCLKDVAVPLKFPVEEHFPIEDVLHPDRPPAEDSEYDTVVSSVVYMDQGRPILDMDELLRQLIVTEVPLRTVCDEACQGLCPECGCNRNLTPCLCGQKAENRPLAVLATLLNENGGPGEE
jgi:uncharacterized protein